MTQSDTSVDRAREAYERAAEQVVRQQEALAALREIVAAMAEDNVRLHQRSLSVIQALQRDVERHRQQLKRLSTARV